MAAPEVSYNSDLADQSTLPIEAGDEDDDFGGEGPRTPARGAQLLGPLATPQHEEIQVDALSRQLEGTSLSAKSDESFKTARTGPSSGGSSEDFPSPGWTESPLVAPGKPCAVRVVIDTRDDSTSEEDDDDAAAKHKVSVGFSGPELESSDEDEAAEHKVSTGGLDLESISKGLEALRFSPAGAPTPARRIDGGDEAATIRAVTSADARAASAASAVAVVSDDEEEEQEQERTTDEPGNDWEESRPRRTGRQLGRELEALADENIGFCASRSPQSTVGLNSSAERGDPFYDDEEDESEDSVEDDDSEYVPEHSKHDLDSTAAGEASVDLDTTVAGDTQSPPKRQSLSPPPAADEQSPARSTTSVDLDTTVAGDTVGPGEQSPPKRQSLSPPPAAVEQSPARSTTSVDLDTTVEGDTQSPPKRQSLNPPPAADEQSPARSTTPPRRAARMVIVLDSSDDDDDDDVEEDDDKGKAPKDATKPSTPAASTPAVSLARPANTCGASTARRRRLAPRSAALDVNLSVSSSSSSSSGEEGDGASRATSIAAVKARYRTPARRCKTNRRVIVDTSFDSALEDDDDEAEEEDGDDEEEEEEEEEPDGPYDSSFIASSDEEGDEDGDEDYKEEEEDFEALSQPPIDLAVSDNDDDDDDGSDGESPRRNDVGNDVGDDAGDDIQVAADDDQDDEETETEIEELDDSDEGWEESDASGDENDASVDNFTVEAKKPSKGALQEDTPVGPRNRDKLVAALLEEYNATVFDGKIPKDLKVTWNPRLLKTAGVTYTKWVGSGDDRRRSARIELASKVLDESSRLNATLLHELCHVAAWLVNGVAKPPHGPVFKQWAEQASQRYPACEVKRCHSYQIHAKYRYECLSCQAVFKRHTKSVKVGKQVCGRCRGSIEFMGAFDRNGKPLATRAPTGFGLFVKDNYAEVSKNTPHKEVMRKLSEMWRERKEAA